MPGGRKEAEGERMKDKIKVLVFLKDRDFTYEREVTAGLSDDEIQTFVNGILFEEDWCPGTDDFVTDPEVYRNGVRVPVIDYTVIFGMNPE